MYVCCVFAIFVVYNFILLACDKVENSGMHDVEYMNENTRNCISASELLECKVYLCYQDDFESCLNNSFILFEINILCRFRFLNI